MPTRRNPNDSPEKRPARGRETPEQAGNEVPHDTRGDGRTEDGCTRPSATPDDHPVRNFQVGVDVDDKSATRRDCFIQETSRPRSRRHRVDRTPALHTAWPPG
jgi:hypothetical protein